MKEMIAFGAGNYYEMNKEEIEKKYNIVALCDNDKEKTGGMLHGKPIVAVENILDYEDAEIVITTPIYQYEIINQLIGMGIKTNKIYTVGSEWMKRRCDSIQVIEEGIKVCIDGREMIITNALEEMICKEVWEGEDYNVKLQENSIVIDIGMNVGYATLFFANKPFVKKVYAFEPDRRVYVKAEKI